MQDPNGRLLVVWMGAYEVPNPVGVGHKLARGALGQQLPVVTAQQYHSSSLCGSQSNELTRGAPELVYSGEFTSAQGSCLS
jgi:hypothetical protein